MPCLPCPVLPCPALCTSCAFSWVLPSTLAPEHSPASSISRVQYYFIIPAGAPKSRYHIHPRSIFTQSPRLILKPSRSAPWQQQGIAHPSPSLTAFHLILLRRPKPNLNFFPINISPTVLYMPSRFCVLVSCLRSYRSSHQPSTDF